MSTARKRAGGLGRDLSALLSSASIGRGVDAEPASDTQSEIAVDQLQPGAHQPRRHFDDTALAELAASIAAQGVVQPIVVRPIGAERYEIVAGERRWRAAQRAGLKTIPAVVRTLDERGAMAVALVENIQRADLNALEEAEALHRLIEQCRLTHEQVAEAVGKSRATVSNLLRLKELNDDVQALVRSGELSLGHAKVLLGVEGARQSSLAALVARQQLSVRQTEALVKAQPGPRAAPSAPPEAAQIQAQLAQRFGLPVKLQQDARGAGKVSIRFRSAAELDALLKRFD